MQPFTRRRFVRRAAGAAGVVTAGAGIRVLTNPAAAQAAGTTGSAVIPFARNGTLTVSTGTLPFVAPEAMTIVGFWAACGTAPQGASVMVDVLQNGATLWSSNPQNRPTIAAGATNGGGLAVPDTTALAPGDVLAVQIVQIGSTTPGSDLGLSMLLQ